MSHSLLRMSWCKSSVCAVLLSCSLLLYSVWSIRGHISSLRMMNTLTLLLVALSLPCEFSCFLPVYLLSANMDWWSVSDTRKLLTVDDSHSLLWFLSPFISSGCTGQSMESIPSSSVVKKPGETLSLSCRGSGFTFSCCSMHWIRQPAGKALEWIGSGYSTASSNTYASSVRGRIEISRDDSNSMVHLRLSNLQPEDSAVYYCAKDTHWLKEAETLNKNSTDSFYNNLQVAVGDMKSD